MDDDFIHDELGQVDIKSNRDPKSKQRDEITVRFETKEVRDMVRAQASNLANFPDSGIRLHVPNHLQKDFKSLMSLSYDMKKRHLNLRRNVKFDEEDLGLCMDMQLKREGPWRRVKPSHVKQAILKSCRAEREGPQAMAVEDLIGLLEEDRETSSNK